MAALAIKSFKRRSGGRKRKNGPAARSMKIGGGPVRDRSAAVVSGYRSLAAAMQDQFAASPRPARRRVADACEAVETRGLLAPARPEAGDWIRRGAYRPDIDGLRCVAILTVVLAHAGVPGLAGGYVGVDVFFVISGFLITRILWDELAGYPATLAGFYERRARRILPALMAAMAATLAAGFVALGPEGLRRAGALGDRHHALRLQLPVLEHQQRLLRRRRPAGAAAAHLVARGRGAVLHPLPADPGADRPRRPPPRPARHRRHLPRLLRALRARAADRPAAGRLLPAAQPRLGARHRRGARARPPRRVPRSRPAVETIALAAAAAILVPVVAYGPTTPLPGPRRAAARASGPPR